MECVILKGSIEPSAIIRCKGNAPAQSLHQVRVAREVSSIEETIVLPGLQDAPRIGLVPAASRKEGGRAEDLAEGGEVDTRKAPAAEEGILFFVTVNLLVALNTLVSGTQPVMR